MRERRHLRCAIYTRKSSEEGLEQDFNSLHAQREACEAYVVSQKHEGWNALPTAYDDGGFSGGSMERPGLKALLADIVSGLIDVVVVYKVDRLTRSLTDFARMVDVFDRHGVSFVSVTQAFNTTSSMGRLTLNVLLSFAQFEREVTGERIRDKVAASKKKGMWMGGSVPLGYEVKHRALIINPDEAETVRLIFRRYLGLRSVDALKDELDGLDLKTKLRPGRSESMVGGRPFSRGHLYRILSSPLYVGKVGHKGQVYDGLHEAIIGAATWDATKATLLENNHRHLVKAHSKNPSLLAGLLTDDAGNPMIATHATKQGKRYRYYMSRAMADHRGGPDGIKHRTWRMPATEIEDAITRVIVRLLKDEHWILDQLGSSALSLAARRQLLARADHLATDLTSADQIARRGVMLALVDAVLLGEAYVELDLRLSVIQDTAPPENLAPKKRRGTLTTVREAIALRRRGGEMKLIIEADGSPEPQPDPALIKALAQAHRWWRDLVESRFATLREIAAAYDTDERYAAWVIRLAFLSPALTRSILDGTQPWEFTLHRLLRAEVPLRWEKQGAV